VRALTEGLRMELHSKNPLHDDFTWRDRYRTGGEQFGRSDQKDLREFMKMAIPASAIARAIAYAIEQPVQVEVDEMVIRQRYRTSNAETTMRPFLPCPFGRDS